VSGIPTPKFEDKAQRQIDQMVAARRATLRSAAHRAGCPRAERKVPEPVPTDRRTFLFAAGRLLGRPPPRLSAAWRKRADQNTPPGAQHFHVAADQTKEQGRPVAGDGGTDRDRNSKPRSAGAFRRRMNTPRGA